MVRITCGNPFSHAHNSTSNHLSPLRRVQGHPEKTGGGRVWAHQYSVLPANQARGPHVCTISRVQEMQREEIRRRKAVHWEHVSCSCPCRYHLPSSGTGRAVFGFRYKLHVLHCHSKYLPFPYAKRHCWLFFKEWEISEMRCGLVYIWSNQ